MASSPNRLEVVDALRGFALFGILLIHVVAFNSPGGPPGLVFEGALLDRLAVLFGLLFVESKFFALFSFMFGLSFALQLLNAKERGADATRLFRRRLLALLGFGVLHAALLWEGDILLVYALVGFVLLRFRDAAPETLLKWARGLLLVPLALYGLGFTALSVARTLPDIAPAVASLDASVAREFSAIRDDTIARQQTASYLDLVGPRLESQLAALGLLATRTPTILAMFLLGLWVGRAGVVRNPEDHLPLLRRVRRLGWSVGLGAGVLVVLGVTFLPTMSGLVVLFFNQALAGPTLGLGYAATFLLLARSPRVRARLGFLANVGRMALTNYLAQSLALTLVYYGYGLGLVGRLGEAAALLVAAAIFAVQIAASALWLRAFRFGPMEWVWRSLTYGQAQPLLRAART